MAALAVSGGVRGATRERTEGRDGRAVSGSWARGAVRADLEEVFRRDYPVVVGVAARVLGSRNEAEDVAQEVFLSFGHSSVPAGEARGWLSVAAAHTALNLIRSGRRRASREEVAAAVATCHAKPCATISRESSAVGAAAACCATSASLMAAALLPIANVSRASCAA